MFLYILCKHNINMLFSHKLYNKIYIIELPLQYTIDSWSKIVRIQIGSGKKRRKLVQYSLRIRSDLTFDKQI